MKKWLLLLSVTSGMSLLFISCVDIRRDIMAVYSPVYASMEDIKVISIVSGGQLIENPGKIYAHGTYLFQNDISKGVHIVDCSDRKKPKKVAFINIPLSNELSVKGNYLYCDNYKDLLVFDIANPSSPKLINRVENVFKPINQNYPPESNCYFECPDPKKGIVIRWERKDDVQNPRCRR